MEILAAQHIERCIDKKSLIANGGQVIENTDGTVSIYQTTTSGDLVLQHLTKHCCECFDTSYSWEPNKQRCMWAEGCDGNINPFLVVLNPLGNDGVIFAVSDNEDEIYATITRLIAENKSESEEEVTE